MLDSSLKIIIVGGGHAGCEAALAGARMGVPTTLISLSRDKIAEMSCNPSIGGVGKGQLVKEIDALGGEMGRNADYTGIQFKRLNTRKGSAVQSSRCQSDKVLYAKRMRETLSQTPNLSLLEGEVKGLLVEDGEMRGVVFQDPASLSPREILCGAVVITTGTFMRGLMHCGSSQRRGGRYGELDSLGLSEELERLGFRLLRLKTGTPARLLRESIDFSGLTVQKGDDPPQKFSFAETQISLPQIDCYLTSTGIETHTIIQNNLSKSPLYSGQIKGIGPRYCPSIEDKVVKFPDKARHLIFLEPESLSSSWIYPNGLSTSLPQDVQEQFLRTLPGLEEVKVARPGYAVEYDAIDPLQLTHSLEARHIRNLFLAGQINGTSGYEEAGAQGLLAGINAARSVMKAPHLKLGRHQAYLGVMVDDLVTLGVTEPYRMFTSRAEFRLSLREDNADLRLSEIGYEIGLLTKDDYKLFCERKKKIHTLQTYLKRTVVKPTDKGNATLVSLGSSPLAYPQTLAQILKRPELTLADTLALVDTPPTVSHQKSIQDVVEIEVKYEGYITIQREEMKRLENLDKVGLPPSLDYSKIAGLSNEIRQKLTERKPSSLADASKVPGITPAALTAILFHVKRKSPLATPSV